MAATTIIYWLEDAQRVYHWHQYRMAMKVHQGLNTFIYFFSVFYLIYTLQKCSVCSVSLWEKISHSRSTRTAPAQQLLPDIQRRSIQDWHRTISSWRSWRGEKACWRQSTVPFKSRRETRDSIPIESRVSRIETRVTVNLLLSCMTLLSKNDALTTAMKTAEIRPLTISEQSWR